MDRTEFKKRMLSLKSYRELNPGKGYWDWKVELFEEGGDNTPMWLLEPYQGPTYAEILENMRKENPDLYNLLAENYARVSRPTSEIVRYRDANGLLLTVGNALGLKPFLDPEIAPGTGDILEVASIGKDLVEGNYGSAAAGLGLLVIPGGAVGKVYRKGRNVVRKVLKQLNYRTRAKKVLKILEDRLQELRKENHLMEVDRVNYANRKGEATYPKSKEYIDKFIKNNLQYIAFDPEAFRDAYVDARTILKNGYSKYIEAAPEEPERKKLFYQILNDDPDYIEFVTLKNIPFDSLASIDQWVDKLRTGIRGIYSSTPNAEFEELEPMFTLTKGYNLGGDRLRTDGGLYVSNSNEIANRFSRSLSSSPGTAAYAIVQAPDIDRTVPIREQLAQIRRRIFPYDLYQDILSFSIKGSQNLGRIDPKKLSSLGYIGKQALYTSRDGNILPAFETSYFADTPGTSVVSVLDYLTSNETKNIAGRWGKGAGGAAITDRLFSPRRIGFSFGDFLREYRTYKSITDKTLTEEGLTKLYDDMFRDLISPNNKRGDELIEKQFWVRDIIRNKTLLGFSEGGEVPPDNSPVHVNPFTGKSLANGAITPILNIEDAVNFTPAGDVLSIRDAYIAVKNNDLLGLGLAGLGFLPFVPRIGRSKVSKVDRPPVPEVHPDYFQKLMEKAERATAKRKLTVNDFYTLLDQAYESLIENEDAFRRAVNADASAGTNYTGVYGDYIKNYSRESSRHNDNLTSIRLTDDIPSEAKAQVDPRDLNWIRVNSRYADPDELDPVFLQMNPGLVRHELGHITDEKAGLDYTNKLGDRSKFESESKLKEMFPKTYKRVQDYLLRGSEIKSHMNEFRDYLSAIGLYSPTETAKSLRLKLDKYGSNFKNLKILFDAYKNKRQFARDYNTIPLIGTSALGINYYLNQEEQRRD